MTPETVHQLLDEVDYEFARKAPPASHPNVPRIPAARYFDKDFFQLEQEAIRKCWVIVGTEHEFPASGSFKVVDRWGGAGVLVIRGDDRQIRAFYNTCQHRGAPVVREEQGSVEHLRCQFHSWTYNLEGELVGIPGRRDFHNELSRECNALRRVSCEVWRGFVFVTLDPNPVPLEEWLQPVTDEAIWFDGLRCAENSSLMLNANWKIAIESNIEVYHVTTVHPTTVALGLDYRGSAETLYRRGHSRMVVPERGYDSRAVRREAERNPLDALLTHSNVSYLLFPFHLTPSGIKWGGRFGLTLQTFWPVDVDKTLLEWFTMVPDWGDGEPPSGTTVRNQYFDQIMEEDTQSVEPIQKSLQAGAFEGPLTSYHERRIYHHEASVDRLIGVERVPEQLRVAQVLPTAD
ncbi:MAG: aromatic ring-hydroxylating dioxygenase subunit alpha [Gammaproteobacteria bacterium]|nr:aromatic ring-hydroxylating dioxygenase subunit alpha [Gammaproteobacteria bacterium]MYE53214.1 aromatic ring-hydroxylating dioxygenase subunit alpha [Gammaproteobacteria bacterium]MYF51006.1 aromatic ring-hydroxylating dioxygenase subunit alpha [Gammaproteobacteria bacterium]